MEKEAESKKEVKETKKKGCMEEEFLNKVVKVLVAFSGNGGGGVPVYYIGKMVDIDDKYVKLNLTGGSLNLDASPITLGVGIQHLEGTIIIKKDFIIAIRDI